MQWRLAKSLEKFREEVNNRWPQRSKDSDGTIGDADHATRGSDHNPWVVDPGGPNVVTGIDITHDTLRGPDTYALAEWFRNQRDARVKYVISNGRIFSSEVSPWVWRKYNGGNPHDHHIHLSVRPAKAHYDNISGWSLGVSTMPGHSQPPAIIVPRTLRKGAVGTDVMVLQQHLAAHGLAVYADGSFGPKTEAAVKEYQDASGLGADGVVGPQTWKALLTLKGTS